MEKPKKKTETKPYKTGVCVECKVRDGDSSKKKLYQCPYCGRWFCEKHIEPRIATTREAIEQISDPVLRDKVLEEWRKPNGHPDVVWTKKYFEDLKKQQEEQRQKFWEAVEDLERIKEEKEFEKLKKVVEEREKIPKYSYEIPIPSTRSISKFIPRKPSFKFEHSREKVDSLVWYGLIICFISLFLPWFSFSFLGFSIGASWFSLLQTEIPKIQTGGLLNYIKTSQYVMIAISLFPIFGFILVIIGLLSSKNWVVFTGSLFLLLSSATVLYFLSQGIEVLGTNVSLISLAGIGLWGFLLGSLLLVYGSAKQVSQTKIFSSLVIVGIVSGMLLSNLSMLSEFRMNQSVTSTYSYPYKEVKSLIEKTIIDYLNPKQPWVQRSINDLEYFGPSFIGSFDGYSICASGTYSCDYGKEKGENINYLYCKPKYFSSYIFCYKKVITSTSGEIKDIIKNCVYSFVLNPKTLEVVSIDFGPLHQSAQGLC